MFSGFIHAVASIHISFLFIVALPVFCCLLLLHVLQELLVAYLFRRLLLFDICLLYRSIVTCNISLYSGPQDQGTAMLEFARP